ncbi:hypothetical protein [Kitasatospora sp. NPDC057198]|uniref:hypothetical protein n=1 Tax=Kitasatospora sp. NPDC057198 TaxID=3346046 RepID=UPI00362A3806
MPTDDELTSALSRAFGTAAALVPEPVQGRLAAGARSAGRRRQRRRRAVVAAALATVVAAGAAGFSAYDRTEAGPTSGAAPMSEQRLIELITHALPEGGTLKPLDQAWAGGKNPHELNDVLTYDRGSGPSMFQVHVGYGTAAPDRVQCQDEFDHPTDGCERTVRPDGSVLLVDKLRQVGSDVMEWRAVWVAPDGREVTVSEYNGGPGTYGLDAPPLTGEELSALVTSPVWAEAFTVLTPVPSPTATASPSPTSTPLAVPDALLDKLTALLPAGATVTARDTAHGKLSVTVAGRHSSLLVTSQGPSARGVADLANIPNAPRQPGDVLEALPGGGYVSTSSFGVGGDTADGALHRMVGVAYPDGALLTIDEWNGDRYYENAPGDPALDLAALKAVVLSPSWRS